MLDVCRTRGARSAPVAPSSAAMPAPVAGLTFLCGSGRGFFMCLGVLISDLLGVVLRVLVPGALGWKQHGNVVCCTAVGEANYAGQFNNIPPSTGAVELREAAWSVGGAAERAISC